MPSFRIALLLFVLPLLARGSEPAPAPLVEGEIWRSKDSKRSLTMFGKDRVEIRDGDVSALARLEFDGKKIVATASFFGQDLRFEFQRTETALVCPDGVKLHPSIALTKNERIERAKKQLLLIGRHLKALEEAGKLRYYSGAAFLLQVKDRLSDEELACYRGAEESSGLFKNAPKPGTPEYVKAYRSLKLPGPVEDWCSAYAGPNFKDFPRARAGAGQRRLWACDRCYQGVPPNEGVVVLWNDLTVEFIPIREIKGADVENGIVPVGAWAPDSRLKKMCYYEH